MKQEHKTLKDESDQLADISADIEVLGPGRMLKEAREMRGLSQQQVADKLNFRTSLVQDIEVDKLDLSLPEAFNRGYLKNYAKLVNISQADVLNSYDQLGVAQRQCADMQSFSKGTEKQAEHNMLMWITYLILGVLITATVVWWLQTPSAQPESIITETVEILGENSKGPAQHDNNTLAESLVTVVNKTLNDNKNLLNHSQQPNAEQVSTKADLANARIASINEISAKESELTTPVANVAFTFSGDCWVNIYDATGERIAWGVKESGYIMRISGQAPFSITLGKPELVQIVYNDVSVDMTAFNAGNIAKFSLPLTP
tara:strand:+ start:3023 stop:3970 length:948 start_codon:yes stop_codon:yes gene_type:complete